MGSGGGRENCRAKAAGGSAGGGGRHLTPARERRGRCPCGQCWMRGPSAEAAPGRGAPRGGEAEARGRPEGHRAAGSSAPAGCPTRSAAAGARRGPEPAPPAGGARTARRPRRSRRGAPGPPVMSPGRLRSAGAGASAATGGERRAEAWAAGGRREGRRKAERRGGRGGPGGGGGERERDSDGGRERGRQRAGREAARAAARAEDEPGRGAAAAGRAGPPDPPGHTVTSTAELGGWAGGRAQRGGGERGSDPATRCAGRALRARTARAEGLFTSPRLARRLSPARRLPRGRPWAPPPGPGSSSSPYNAAGGLRRPARYPTRAAAGPRRLRLPGSAPAPGPCQGLQPCAAGRGPDPESGGGRGPEGARAGGRGAPWPRQKMAAWHDPGPAPRPAPPPGLEAPRGGGTLEAPGRAEGRPGPAPGSAASRSSRGHLWLGGAGRRRAWEGRALGERARSGGARSRGGQAERRGGGGVEPGSSLPPLRAVGAGRRWWRRRRRRRSVGAGREWARIPGPGRGGLEGAGAGAARLETTPVGMPGSPPAADSPCTHSHAPPPARCRRVLESFASAQ